MKKYDRGSLVLVEAQVVKSAAFGGSALFDPDTVLVTITDCKGVVKVNGDAMTKIGVGAYFYKCQTVVDWEKGRYDVKVSLDASGESDVTMDDYGFVLK